MATFDYAEMAATTQELLIEFGAPVILRQPGTGEYDPETGTVDSNPTDYAGIGAVFDYTAQNAGLANLAGTVVEAGDKQLYLAPYLEAGGNMPPPRPTDIVLAAGETWRVVSVKPLAPAGLVLLYEVQLRH